MISGAPSYPERIAVQRGPQILAVEQHLNPELEIWAAGLQQPIALQSIADQLPKIWRGAQAYVTAGFHGNDALGKRLQSVVMVPIADAGQTGS